MPVYIKYKYTHAACTLLWYRLILLLHDDGDDGDDDVDDGDWLLLFSSLCYSFISHVSILQNEDKKKSKPQ